MAASGDEDAQAAAVVIRIRGRIDPEIASVEEIERSVHAAWARFAHARIRTFIPVLVERAVRQGLLRPEGPGPAPTNRLP